MYSANVFDHLFNNLYPIYEQIYNFYIIASKLIYVW